MSDSGRSPASRVARLQILDGVLYSLTTFAVWLRLYTRFRIVRKTGTSDWWMLAAWIFATGQVVLWLYYDQLGNAQHIRNVKPENMLHLFLLAWIIQVVYPLGLCVIKISVLFLYHELFPSDRFRLLLTSVMIFVTVMSTASVLAFVFQCIPVQSFWVPRLRPERKCVDGKALSTASSALSFSTDVMILLLPMKYMIALRVSTREKIQLIALMSLGALTCIASVLRFSAIEKVYQSHDFTWDGYDLTFWSTIEFFCAMITACIPTIRPLWVKCSQKLKDKIENKRASSSSSSETPRPSPKFVQPEPRFMV